eukprot:TRINITY_DN29334_c0_g1_i1.p1 TRINITY_DN29334_c0_g1~~TRINITY_DN29334_c0_g1_i1.p1  ORF type:complete len:740 (-),score=80.00 TRINITY_DN29334_c0_g1_i1:13-2208(-)
MAGAIHRLPQDVVNRIAAGEVIHRPSSALKEMLENSLDAGATQITVTTRGGGLKLLEIKDNGHGIRLEDLSIVCERFTTSKLRKFEDLQTIATFGFRGEALASITHVARVSITTMVEGSACAYRASYCDGRLVGEKPKACAGTRGTTISVEDLFYNMQARRKALRSPADEYQRILQIVTRYAIINPQCGFSCRKAESNAADLNTPRASSVERNIALLFGQSVGREITSVNCDHLENKQLGFKMQAWVTNANYSSKKPTFVLFINGRLVESTSLKRSVDSVYSGILPKNTHPFACLSLFVQPERVDVNVHPTKQEVHFLNEEEISSAVREALAAALTTQNVSRTFTPSVVAPPARAPMLTDTESPRQEQFSTPSKSKEAPSKTIRVSEQRGAMELYVTRSQQDREPAATQEAGKDVSVTEREPISAPKTEVNQVPVTPPHQAPVAPPPRKRGRDYDPDQLTSVNALLRTLDMDCHDSLAELFKGASWVGWVNSRFSLVQFRTGLYLLDLCIITRELAYQLVLIKFGKRRRRIALSCRPPLAELALISLDQDGIWQPEDGDKAILAQRVSEILTPKGPMLLEYFSLQIEKGCLVSLPQLFDRYVPPLARLPLFAVRLAADVDWSSEQKCFEDVANELADLYAFPDVQTDTHEPTQASVDTDASSSTQGTSQPVPSTTTDAMSGGTPSELRWLAQHVILPACRAVLVPPTRWATDGTVVQIACLESLYKVFERC